MDIACSTHKGIIRSNNEDSVYFSGGSLPIVAIVADGMGGHAAGQTASSMSVSFMRKCLEKMDVEKITDGQLKKLVRDASNNLLKATEKDEALKSMGTTLVMAVVTKNRAKIVNVGDSRAYLLSGGHLKRVTKDHSYVQYLVDNKILTDEEARTHPYKHVITRAVGMENVEADIYDIAFSRGDILLLCSDGLIEHVMDHEIESILLEETSADKKTEKLIKTTLDRGGSDNVTVLVLEHNEMIGRLLQNRYRITKELAEGGMSRVYLAKCKRTGNTVAVKIFKQELMDTPEAVDGFKREAYICSRLHHKNLIHLIDVGKHDKLKYIVMDYIEGRSLKDIVDGKECDLKFYTDTVIKMLDALSYAHQKGVIHKDLKPQNVLIKDGEPVIIDFGIAEEISATEDAENAVLGTIDYFSPEQAMGESVDYRTDIYSAGIMLYEMATGQVPFTGTDNVSVALKHLHQPAKPPKELDSNIPDSLNKIIMKAISKDKEHRYPSAAAMADDLRRAFDEPDGEYVLTFDEEKSIERNKQKTNLKRLIIGLSAAVAVIVVAIIGMLLLLMGNVGESTVYMPYVVDMDLDVAQDTLKTIERDIAVEVIYEIRLDYEEDKVVEQSPTEATVLNDGDRIVITVSSQTLKGGTMPNVLGMTEEQAIRAIESAKIEKPEVRYKTGGEKGKVFSQEPSVGDKVMDKAVIYVYK